MHGLQGPAIRARAGSVSADRGPSAAPNRWRDICFALCMSKQTKGNGMMRIEQLMSRPVQTCHPEDSIDAPARLMWDHDCGAIPVVDGDGKLVGIITDRDICMAAMFQAKPLHAIPVAAVMTRQVYTCDAEDSLEAAERMMQLKQVRRVPVLADGGRPVGILSINDIARVAGAARKNGADREVVQTLAAICEPHAHAPQVRPSSP